MRPYFTWVYSMLHEIRAKADHMYSSMLPLTLIHQACNQQNAVCIGQSHCPLQKCSAGAKHGVESHSTQGAEWLSTPTDSHNM